MSARKTAHSGCLWGDDMLWAFAAAGAIGLLLGLRFRLPALLAASGVVVAACLLVAYFTQPGPVAAVAMTFGMLSVLQFGYVVGLMVSCSWSRERSWPTADVTLPSGQRSKQGKARARW
jgi:uncharacterized membrane protein YkvI